ncbi:putative BcABA3 [Seiridium cardinale]|uniref:BcABA3 n=1 Tax=Seiridium cardinale TaxID=138064 RepID=A0ABR2X8B3_9PEZI
MRDFDALSRFTIFLALVRNDFDTVPTDDECELLSEVGIYLYDAVAFYRHCSKGETNNTFAYVPPDMRIDSFLVTCEMLWALDAYYVRRPKDLILINFVPIVGGPVYIMMHRDRFVEQGCTIGRPETDDIIELARRKFKLWNRVDVAAPPPQNEKICLIEGPGVERYQVSLAGWS